MGIAYKQDIVAWANEQAALIRAGRFELLDLEHIAEEIEDVGKSEQRELENRMAVLIAHLLKWQYQPTHRGASWQRTIKDQRKMVLKRLKQTPSLKISLVDVEWIDDAWTDATLQAAKETGIELIKFPQACPWTMEQVLDDEFLPS
ncbi:MAG TPA: DUF29 domain-containing protein [Agitococcus sp.]|nr:DUF29 domain-containing protein [Agitococcus sp.]HNG46257.1 DUF29 domain-containing protein [Agitococcus sp.]